MKIYVHGESDIPAIATPIFGFAVINKTLSGLKYDIWMDNAGYSRNTPHKDSPRLKVDVDGQRIPFSISDAPRLLVKGKKHIAHEADVLKWIQQNKDILLKHYKREISDKELLDSVTKLA